MRKVEIIFFIICMQFTHCFIDMIAEEREAIDAVEMEKIKSKRTAKLTEKAQEDKLHRLIAARRGVLAQITRKRKEI